MSLFDFYENDSQEFKETDHIYGRKHWLLY